MKKDVYTLPEIQFVGGSSQALRFRLKTEDGQSVDLNGASVSFVMVDFANEDPDAVPVVQKDEVFPFDEDAETEINAFTIRLTRQDTLNLSGKYRYQITVTDHYGKTEIPNKGIIYIDANDFRS